MEVFRAFSAGFCFLRFPGASFFATLLHLPLAIAFRSFGAAILHPEVSHFEVESVFLIWSSYFLTTRTCKPVPGLLLLRTQVRRQAARMAPCIARSVAGKNLRYPPTEGSPYSFVKLGRHPVGIRSCNLETFSDIKRMLTLTDLRLSVKRSIKHEETE